MRTGLCIASLALVIVKSAVAQTEISGGIFSNTMWTIDGSPYVITDDVVVFDDLLLTIEPGVIVQVQPGKRIELRNSRLVAMGTEAQPILFTCSDAASTWQGFVPLGLVHISSGNQMHMEHCIIERAVKGVDFEDAYHTPYEFLHCEFRNCDSGTWSGGLGFTYGYYLFQDCFFHDNEAGIYGGLHTVIGSRFENNVIGVSTYHLEDCVISGNTQFGAFARHMTGCLMTGNNIGYDGDLMANYYLDNNVAVGNTIGFRMAGFFTDESSFANNIICRNSLYNIQRISWGGNAAAHIQGTCFCTDNEAAVAASIYDAVDDISVGLIDYLPLTTDPWCMNFHVGVEEVLESDFSIAPNPAIDQVVVNGRDLSRITVLDAAGRSLIDLSFGARNIQDVDVIDLPSGMYVMRTLQAGRWSHARLIKQ